jgi:hypothetical protein
MMPRCYNHSLVMKFVRAILVAVLLASICAACGGGNGPNPSPTNYGSAPVSIG